MARNGIKTGGRKKGSINKKSAEEIDRAGRVLDLIESKYLEKDIKDLSAHQRMMLYADMMEYKAPKLSRQTVDAGEGTTVKITIKKKSNATL
jgi:Cdc6-like AAA superfamily ATPase